MKEKGITLIALVVTIVVLLILAGVSISMLTGENGIITQANNAKKQTEHSKVEEGMYLKKVEYEAKNYPEEQTKTFLEFLKEENIIESTTLPSKINVEELLGQKISMGNGTDSDVYKLENKEVTEGIKYIVNYCDKSETTLIADLGIMEMYEDDGAIYTFSYGSQTTHELTLMKDGEKINFNTVMSPELENIITKEKFELDTFINSDGNIDIEEFWIVNYRDAGKNTGSGGWTESADDYRDNLWFIVNITINNKKTTSETLVDFFHYSKDGCDSDGCGS